MTDSLYRGYRFFFESDAKASHLVLMLNREDKILNYQIEMIQNNPELPILPFHIRRKDGDAYCYYNITSKQKLSQMLQRKKLNKQEFIDILLGVANAILKSENYFLPNKGFLLEEEYIYLTLQPFKLFLVYIPVSNGPIDVMRDLRQLISRLMTHVSIEESAKDNFLHKILVEMSNDTFNITTLCKLLNNLKTGSVKNAPAVMEDQKGEQCVDSNFINSEPSKQNHVEVSHSQKAKASHLNDVASETEEVRELGYSKKSILINILSQILVIVVSLLTSLQTGLFDPKTFEATTLLGLILIITVGEYVIFNKLMKKEMIVKKKAMNKQTKASTISKISKTAKSPGNTSNDTLYPQPINMNKKEILNDLGQQPPVYHEIVAGDDTEIICFNNSIETEILGHSESQEAYLMSARDGVMERIIVHKPSFVIGKLREQVDYVLNSKSISRIHAEIIYENGSYHIIDINSKNGTFVNGERIESNKNYPIQDEDRIAFANKEFVFKIS